MLRFALRRLLIMGPLVWVVLTLTFFMVKLAPGSPFSGQRHRLVLAGDVPSPIDPPAGCRFHPRCPYAIAECTQIRPRLREITSGHLAACIRIGAEEPDIEPAAAKGIQVQQPD